MKKFTTLLFALLINFISFSQVTAPYEQNFETTTIPELPEYWSAISNSDWGQSVETVTYFETQSIKIIPGVPATPDEINTILVTPELTDLDTGKRIVFNIVRNEAAILEIGTMTNPLNASTFLLLETITEIPTEEYTEVTISLEGITEGNYIAFKNISNLTNGNIYIDDFIYEENDCLITTPYYQDCETMASSDNNSCWNKLKIGGGVIGLGSNGGHDSEKGILLRAANEPETDITIAVSPKIMDLDNSKQVRFWMGKSSYEEQHLTLEIGTLTDITNVESFISFYTVEPDVGDGEGWIEITAPLATDYTEENGQYIGFKITSDIIPMQLLRIDDIYIENNPSFGTADLSFATINIFPNPASEKINIIASEKINKTVIYSVLGQKIKETRHNTKKGLLDVKTLKKGLYFIHLQGDTKKGVVKFEKK